MPRPRSFLRLERHGKAVHAIALAGRRRAVGEHMPQMAAAIGAMHLGAAHKEAAVFGLTHRTLQRGVEARPARAALKFGLGIEQRLATAATEKRAGALLRVQRTGPGALRAVLAQHMIA